MEVGFLSEDNMSVEKKENQMTRSTGCHQGIQQAREQGREGGGELK